jgi:flagellin-like hook-associated protein FlgL
MSVSSVGSQASLIVQSLVDMRQQLDGLQQQIRTGKKSDTYAGMGLDRGLAVALRSQLAAVGGFDDAITNVGVRISLAQSSLGRISDIAHTIKATALQTPAIDSSGSTTAQSTASMELREMLGLLNTQSGDRYLFSGRASDKPAVESFDHIMNGDGTRAGLLQVTAERKQADLGSSGLGRLVVSIPALSPTTVNVAEDAVSPFGFKLAAVSSNLTGATVTQSGPPNAYAVDLGATNPSSGDTIKYDFTLPDGSSESITLTATTSATPGPNEFAIGATPAATAANLQAALTGAVGKLADTSLTAASAMAASNDFFNIDAAHPPQRVAGPPFDTATAQVAGTPADTVSWYTGEAGSDPARGTATARVDPSLTVSYGLRANEQGIRWVVQNVAALAAMTFSQSDPNAAARNAALTQRVAPALDPPSGTQKVEDIEADLAGAQTTMASATDRHNRTKTTLADMVDHIEGVSNEEVASKIMALQTSLQASLQTTALLLKTNLVNYI